MSSDVLRWARSCSRCASSKFSRHAKTPLQHRPSPDARFASLHVDLVGPLPESEGLKYLFTIVDRFTRWIEAVPLTCMTAEACAAALLRHWIARFGVPSDVTTDQGRQFSGSLWSKLHRLLGIKSLRTTAYHPQANGMVERFHRVLKERLMARDAGQDWMSHLPMVLLGVRASIREDSMTSPVHLVLGAPLRLPGQMLPDVLLASDPPSTTFVRDLQNSIKDALPMPVVHHGSTPSYLPSALKSAKAVYVRVDAVRPPLTRPYDGPYPVISRTDKTFVLQKGNKDWTVSVDRLKPAVVFPPGGQVPLPPSLPLDEPLDIRDTIPAVRVAPAIPAPADLPPPERPPAPVASVLPVRAPVPAPAPAPVPYRTRTGRISRPPDRFVAGS